jgi:hypothetical protein
MAPIDVHVPIVSWRNVVLQVVCHFLVAGVSKIAGLRGSVVLEGNLESTVRTSSWNSEARPQTAVDGCQKMLELLYWYEENRLLIGIKRSTVQVEATGKTTSVS